MARNMRRRHFQFILKEESLNFKMFANWRSTQTALNKIISSRYPIPVLSTRLYTIISKWYTENSE